MKTTKPSLPFFSSVAAAIELEQRRCVPRPVPVPVPPGVPIGTFWNPYKTAPRPVAEGDLVNITKSASAARASRRKNYTLQRAASRLLPSERVSKCQFFTRPNKHISIYHSTEHGKAFYKNLMACGSVWNCPVCAAKIAERRAAETLAAMWAHRATGGEVLLLGLTAPHYFDTNIEGQLTRQNQALRQMWGTRAVRRLLESWGCVGSIRALEVTHGQNGWHPHFHILLFVRSGLDVESMKRSLYVCWLKVCLAVGLPAPGFAHGVDIRDGNYASDYVTKGLTHEKKEGWGLHNEITKGHIKTGRDSSTPFDLLRAYDEGNKQAGALFVEYSKAFKGRRQLVWSPGLKALFSIGDRSDLEIAESAEEPAVFGCNVSREDWWVVMAWRARAQLLEAYEEGGAVEVGRLLSILRADELPDDVGATARGFGMTEDRFLAFWRRRAKASSEAGHDG